MPSTHGVEFRIDQFTHFIPSSGVAMNNIWLKPYRRVAVLTHDSGSQLWLEQAGGRSASMRETVAHFFFIRHENHPVIWLARNGR
jgi:hypothetical protein